MVNSAISESDTMFRGDNLDHYFAVGQSARHCIEVAMAAAGTGTFENILDFPCGYGRVLRHLQAAFPAAKLTACDIEREGVDFCAQTFGAIPAYSSLSPGEIQLSGGYDLIWVGSLLTHVNAAISREFLRLFHANLRPGGLLVFTLHGRNVAERMAANPAFYGVEAGAAETALKDYREGGFGYASYPTTMVNVGDNYGISLASPCWAYNELQTLPQTRLVNYSEVAWDAHQDVVSFSRA
jgi:SAM-dependent methyltransferase